MADMEQRKKICRYAVEFVLMFSAIDGSTMVGIQFDSGIYIDVSPLPGIKF
jgi:hypothetical protein